MSENMILKIANNGDILQELESWAKENNVDYAVLMKGTGSIKAFEIISHALKGSIIRTHNESDFEINAVSGQIQKSGKDSFQIKLRVVLTKSGFSAKEGELIKGKAAGPLEIEIKKKDMGKIIYA